MRRTALVAFVLALQPLTTRAEVPVISNPREAPARTEVHYDEAWRVGADEEADYIFGVIIDATCDADGNVYLLDRQLQQVVKFAPDGRYLGLVARQGEGPGEIDMALRIRRWGADQLAVLKVFPGSLVVVGTDGTPGPTITLEAGSSGEGQAFLSSMDFACRDDVLVCQCLRMTYGDGGQTETDLLSSFTLDGRERHRFGAKDGGYDFSRPIVVREVEDGFPLGRWCLGRGGEVYLAPSRDEYLIEVRDPDGRLLRRIERDVPPHRRTDAQKEAVKNDYRFGGDAELPEISFVIDDFDPPITRLSWVADELWIDGPQAERDLPGGASRRTDVFSAEGHLREERIIFADHDPYRDRLITLPDGRIVRIVNFRSAHASTLVGMHVQVGESKERPAGDDSLLLEVALLVPRK